jgi:hypothetical protein
LDLDIFVWTRLQTPQWTLQHKHHTQ